MRSRDARGNSGGGVDVSTGGKGSSLAGGGGVVGRDAGFSDGDAGAFPVAGAFGFAPFSVPPALPGDGFARWAGAAGFVVEGGGEDGFGRVGLGAMRAAGAASCCAKAGVASPVAQAQTRKAAIMVSGGHAPAAAIFSFLPRTGQTRHIYKR